MTIKDVAYHPGVSWDTVKEIQSQNLQRRFARLMLKHLRQIAIENLDKLKVYASHELR